MATTRAKFCILGLFCLIWSCKNEKYHQNPSFYFWKTQFSLSNIEKINLAHLKVTKLYVRMFDVVWDGVNNEAVPEGILKAESQLSQFEIIPVVYIKNEVFKNLNLAQSAKLAQLVASQISKMSSKYGFTYQKAQMDCDWTASTRETFFHFLTQFKAITALKLDCTIRLHQIKYKQKTGIPPCDEGVLMFYNMGKIGASSGPNSIFNQADALKYVKYISDYPKPLSAALPIFSWAIHCRAGKVKQLLPRREFVDFTNNMNFEIDTPFIRVKEPNILKGIAFEKNDYLKMESISHQECEQAALLLQKYAPKQGFRNVIFFDLDEHSIHHFDHEKITDIYTLIP